MRTFQVHISIQTPALLTALLFSHQASASDESAHEIRSLMRARSKTEVPQVRLRAKALEHQRRVCEAQLKGSRVPAACFKVFQFERQEKPEMSWLEGLCVKQVDKSEDWQELQSATESVDLPADCRRAAQTRLLDLKYSAESERPEQLFRKRPVL